MTDIARWTSKENSTQMLERFQHRSYELENLDKGTYTSEEYEGFIVGLRRINHWLGDTKALRGSLLKAVERANLSSFSVLDVGAGSGELLRVTASWARATTRRASLVGVELNKRSAESILEESLEFPEICSVQADGLDLPFLDNSFDYAIQSLTLHHFDDQSAVRILREMGRVAVRGVFVIDLHRNPIAYFLFAGLGYMILRNRLMREDGALSILRSFKPHELNRLGRQALLARVAVDRCFPSRLVLSAEPRDFDSVLT